MIDNGLNLMLFLSFNYIWRQLREVWSMSLSHAISYE